ncbi:MAG: HNH endonuclease signature motif containing protein [Acidimicrobiia bacterium]
MRARVDVTALARGYTAPDEICELEGGGPVPVSVMERILVEHPIVDLVLTRGRDVTHVAHLGRSGDTYLKTAIEWRDPVCAIEGCAVATNLDDHHIEAIADGGVTSLEQYLRLCGHHHDCITYRGYRLVGSHRSGWHLEPPERPPDPGDPERSPRCSGGSRGAAFGLVDPQVRPPPRAGQLQGDPIG